MADGNSLSIAETMNNNNNKDDKNDGDEDDHLSEAEYQKLYCSKCYDILLKKFNCKKQKLFTFTALLIHENICVKEKQEQDYLKEISQAIGKLIKISSEGLSPTFQILNMLFSTTNKDEDDICEADNTTIPKTINQIMNEAFYLKREKKHTSNCFSICKYYQNHKEEEEHLSQNNETNKNYFIPLKGRCNILKSKLNSKRVIIYTICGLGNIDSKKNIYNSFDEISSENKDIHLNLKQQYQPSTIEQEVIEFLSNFKEYNYTAFRTIFSHLKNIDHKENITLRALSTDRYESNRTLESHSDVLLSIFLNYCEADKKIVSNQISESNLFETILRDPYMEDFLNNKTKIEPCIYFKRLLTGYYSDKYINFIAQNCYIQKKKFREDLLKNNQKPKEN